MTTITLDHPMIRAGRVCPICGDHKEPSLLVCWPCYSNHGMRNGGTERVNGIIDSYEHDMMAARAASSRVAL